MNYVSKEFDALSTKELYEILKARYAVFTEEQGITEQDMDDVDFVSQHFYLEEGGKVAAYLRAYYKDEEKEVLKIGRVLSIKHGIGLGTELMNKALEEIKANNLCKKIFISAQKTAVDFYKGFGFEITSDEYMEAGIVHLAMEKVIE